MSVVFGKAFDVSGIPSTDGDVRVQAAWIRFGGQKCGCGWTARFRPNLQR